MELLLLLWFGLAIAAILTAIMRGHPYVGPIIIIALFVPFGGAIGLAWACSPVPAQAKKLTGSQKRAALIRNSRVHAATHSPQDDFFDSLREGKQ